MQLSEFVNLILEEKKQNKKTNQIDLFLNISFM